MATMAEVVQRDDRMMLRQRWVSPSTSFQRGASRRRHAGLQRKTTSFTSLKEKLKTACLERARQKRHELLRQRRQGATAGHHHALINGQSASLDQSSTSISPARQMIQEEMRRHGVVARSIDTVMDGCMEDAHRRVIHSGNTQECGMGICGTDATMAVSAMEQTPPSSQDMEEATPTHPAGTDGPLELPDPEEPYLISEEDFIELLQEVDDELCSEDEFLENACAAYEMEEMELQSQIEEYERWQETEMGMAMDDGCGGPMHEEQVICPLCCVDTLHLVSQQGADGSSVIVCSNRSCALRLPCPQSPPMSASNVHHSSPLATLRNRLCEVHEHHGHQCSSLLRCRMHHDGLDGSPSLVACCDACRLFVKVH